MKSITLTILFLLALSPIYGMDVEKASLLNFDDYRITRVKKKDSETLVVVYLFNKKERTVILVTIDTGSNITVLDTHKNPIYDKDGSPIILPRDIEQKTLFAANASPEEQKELKRLERIRAHPKNPSPRQRAKAREEAMYAWLDALTFQEKKERQKKDWHPLFGGSYDVVPMGENRWLSK